MSIEDLINNVVDQDFAKAGPTFHELMQDILLHLHHLQPR
jgi:hypothetical protein